MCSICVEALERLFPEIPDDECYDFLICTTCFPFGRGEDTVRQLEELKNLMVTSDYKECYGIAADLMHKDWKRFQEQQATTKEVVE